MSYRKYEIFRICTKHLKTLTLTRSPIVSTDFKSFKVEKDPFVVLKDRTFSFTRNIIPTGSSPYKIVVSFYFLELLL